MLDLVVNRSVLLSQWSSARFCMTVFLVAAHVYSVIAIRRDAGM